MNLYSRLRFPGHALVFAVCIAASLAGKPTRAAEKVTVPRYQPVVGLDIRWRSERAMSSRLPPILKADETGELDGVFDLTQRVMARTRSVYRERWSLSPDVPKDASSTGQQVLNELQRGTLQAYGIRELTLETGRHGDRIIGAKQLLKTIQRKAAAASPGSDMAASVLQQVENDPFMTARILVPEAALLASGQSEHDSEWAIGERWSSADTEMLRGVEVPVSIQWQLESVDTSRRMAVFILTETYDPEAFSQSVKNVESLTTQQAPGGAAPAGAESRASLRRVARLMVSLTDGSVVEAAERRKLMAAGMESISTLHVYRQGVPKRLSIPSEQP